MQSTEEKLESVIVGIFRRYGVDPNGARFRQILNFCKEELEQNPKLEQELFTSDSWNYYVMQSILYNINPA